jgi:hypothetical protein
MSKRHASPHVGRRSFLKAATLAGAGSLAPSVAADAQVVAQSPPRSATMVDDLTAEELRSLLKLEPNQTCGTSTRKQQQHLALSKCRIGRDWR